MGKQLVVHIGPRKTGTTAIQSSLAGHRGELAEHGVSYPGERNQHHQVVNRFLGRKVLWHNDLETDRQPKKLAQLLRGVSDVPQVVMSSEVLSQFLPADIDRFVAAIPDREVTVVISYRRYEDLLPSTWQQAVKEGLPITLEEWLTEVLRPGAAGVAYPSHPAFPRRIDLATLAEDWGRVGWWGECRGGRRRQSRSATHLPHLRAVVGPSGGAPQSAPRRTGQSIDDA